MLFEPKDKKIIRKLKKTLEKYHSKMKNICSEMEEKLESTKPSSEEAIELTSRFLVLRFRCEEIKNFIDNLWML